MYNPLVLQTDFGLQDGAVSAMYGVAYGVCNNLPIFDLTHDIPQYNVWEASYRLIQTIKYWQEGTVFVSVVDPGVGSNRKSIAVKTNLNQYVITPDNGTITHLYTMNAIQEVRKIDDQKHRLPNSYDSYTFHGRDVYAYNGARLASGIIQFEDLGEEMSIEELVCLETVPATKVKESVKGTIDVLDVRFGSLWTNIPKELFQELGLGFGKRVEITITNEQRQVYKNIITFAKSFADVNLGEPLLYVNSLENMAIAINQGSFAKAYNIGVGTSWKIEIRKAPKVIYD